MIFWNKKHLLLRLPCSFACGSSASASASLTAACSPRSGGSTPSSPRRTRRRRKRRYARVGRLLWSSSNIELDAVIVQRLWLLTKRLNSKVVLGSCSARKSAEWHLWFRHQHPLFTQQYAIWAPSLRQILNLTHEIKGTLYIFHQTMDESKTEQLKDFKLEKAERVGAQWAVFSFTT